MNTNRIIEFKKASERFNKAVKYIIENEKALKTDSKKWEIVTKNFKLKFEEPLDFAWNALSKAEKARFGSLYYHRKAMQNEFVKKIIEMFDRNVWRNNNRRRLIMAHQKQVEELRKKNQIYCKECGKKLNIYNRYSLCHTCLAKAIKKDI